MEQKDLIDLMDLAQEDVSGMSTRKLRNYISRALKFINKGNYFMPSQDEDVDRTYEYLVDRLGSRYGNLTANTGYDTKDELFDKVVAIKVHLRTAEDSFFENGVKEGSKYEKAYESFKENWDMPEMSEYEWTKMVTIFGTLGTDILEEKVSSEDVKELITYTNDTYGSRSVNSLLDIMEKVYYDMMHDDTYSGMSVDAFSRTFSEKVKDKIKKY